MSYQFYKIIHVLGIMLVFLAFGGLAVVGLSSDASRLKPARTLLASFHGVGMLLLLVAGFGLIAKLGGGFPGWMIAKVVIWLVLGASVVVFRKKPDAGKPMLIVLPILGLIAAGLALYKPF